MLRCSIGVEFRVIPNLCKRVWTFGGLIRGGVLKLRFFGLGDNGLFFMHLMRAFYSDQFVLPLPEGHRFPMAKYRLLRDRLGLELPEVQLGAAEPASDGELALVHTRLTFNRWCRAP